jgi:hypothetical protein
MRPVNRLVRVLVILLAIPYAYDAIALAAETTAADTKQGPLRIDFADETVGAPSTRFVPVVGHWRIDQEGENRLLMVDGRQWKEGQPATGIADRARSLYGERYAEFLDNVKAFAYYPYAVVAGCDDFQGGEITFRFKPLEGKIDQGAGILFNLKPNGDYLALRANALENNLVLWQFVRGKRTSVKWIKDTPTSTKEWHDLKLKVDGKNVEGYLDGKLLMTHTLEQPVSGRVGVWSKADSVVYFDDYLITPALKNGK